MILNKLQTLPAEILEKLKQLDKLLIELQPIAVAFSGGVDSTLLLYYAHCLLGDNAIAFTAVAPNFAPDEISRAKDFCTEHKIKHRLIDIPLSEMIFYKENSPDRCYECKKIIFDKMLAEIPDIQPANLSKPYSLVDATNADDLFDYRPGLRALAELEIKSPLSIVGLKKSEIRSTLKALDLQIWNLPSFACLASRFPYGEPITSEKLNSIYFLEKAIKEQGFNQVRVRYHQLNSDGGTLAAIEVAPDEREKFFNLKLMDLIDKLAKDAGFTYATLNLAGYKMGNLNR